MTPIVAMVGTSIRFVGVLFGIGDCNKHQKWALQQLKEAYGDDWPVQVVMTDQRTSTDTITESLGTSVKHIWNSWHVEQVFAKKLRRVHSGQSMLNHLKIMLYSCNTQATEASENDLNELCKDSQIRDHTKNLSFEIPVK
jgi:hypothetical protein